MSSPTKTISLFNEAKDTLSPTVFSTTRKVKTPIIELPKRLSFNERIKMDGIDFLSHLPEKSIPVAFFDPQYRGILDKMGYGNEGESRGKARSDLPQMNESKIAKFIQGIDKALIPSGHLFLWMDKFHLCSGFSSWLTDTSLEVVDMVTWDKGKIGMGYRTRRRSEYLVILQKTPKRAKGVWKIHNIPDVWLEQIKRNGFTHKKPIDLQSKLIASVSNDNDIVIDPAAGSFSVMEACNLMGRNFLGCDING